VEEPVDWRPSGSVILIDAQEERAIAVCELLMAAGYQVVWTPDGAIALSQLDVLQPQVVIVSLRLPGMDGWEVVAGLRRQAPRVQVLLLGDRAEASPILVDHPNLTVDVVLGEKFDPERLLHEVNTLSQAAARAVRMNSQATGVMTRARSPLADRSNDR
jgi:two-component system sensor histidine kinase/response regulator